MNARARSPRRRATQINGAMMHASGRVETTYTPRRLTTLFNFYMDRASARDRRSVEWVVAHVRPSALSQRTPRRAAARSSVPMHARTVQPSIARPERRREGREERRCSRPAALDLPNLSVTTINSPRNLLAFGGRWPPQSPCRVPRARRRSCGRTRR